MYKTGHVIIVSYSQTPLCLPYLSTYHLMDHYKMASHGMLPINLGYIDSDDNV